VTIRPGIAADLAIVQTWLLDAVLVRKVL